MVRLVCMITFAFPKPLPVFLMRHFVDEHVAAAQSNAGTYVVDENGAFVNRTTLASTIPSNIGLSENTTVFRLERLNATALFQTIFADSYTTGYGIWTRFVPGSTEV